MFFFLLEVTTLAKKQVNDKETSAAAEKETLQQFINSFPYHTYLKIHEKSGENREEVLGVYLLLVLSKVLDDISKFLLHLLLEIH